MHAQIEVTALRTGGVRYWVRVGRAVNYGFRRTEPAAREAAQDDARVLRLVNQLQRAAEEGE